jgi:cardiolipin synthase
MKEVFTISNLFSFLRIFLVIPIFYYLSIYENILALIIIIVAVVTDWLDGYFARKFNQITQLGKVLDPLADKICTLGGFIALTLYQQFPLWLTVVIIVRDITLILGSFILYRHRHVVNPSNRPGKLTAFLIVVLAAAYILQIKIIQIPLIILVTFMMIYSIANYAWAGYNKISAQNEE